jgi:hypothetical protein
MNRFTHPKALENFGPVARETLSRFVLLFVQTSAEQASVSSQKKKKKKKATSVAFSIHKKQLSLYRFIINKRE